MGVPAQRQARRRALRLRLGHPQPDQSLSGESALQARINTATTLGGPVRIPKLFNGKNRLFFMSNFEEYNSRQTTPTLVTTLPAAMRTGDFSSILPTGTHLADPNSRTGTTYPNSHSRVDSIPRQQIPASRISPDSTLLLSKWDPLPNLARRRPGCLTRIINTA